MSEYREYPEQFRFCDRNFRPYDRVIMVGPPPDQDQMMMTARPQDHKLYLKEGNIDFGASGSIRCYPDEPEDSELGRMYFVCFEEDRLDCRQVDALWLVKIEDFKEWETR